eukprot:2352067-Amphidinium_carterae.1
MQQGVRISDQFSFARRCTNQHVLLECSSTRYYLKLGQKGQVRVFIKTNSTHACMCASSQWRQ